MHANEINTALPHASGEHDAAARSDTPQPLSTRRLTRLYIIALSMVALLSIIGQGLVQFSLAQQSSDSRIINIAGRQRMLSQRLSKAALASSVAADPATRQARLAELQTVLNLWQRSHQGLQHGDAALGLPANINSTTITGMYGRIAPQYQAMVASAQALLDPASA